MRHTGSRISRTQITSPLSNAILTTREKIRHAQLSKIPICEHPDLIPRPMNQHPGPSSFFSRTYCGIQAKHPPQLRHTMFASSSAWFLVWGFQQVSLLVPQSPRAFHQQVSSAHKRSLRITPLFLQGLVPTTDLRSGSIGLVSSALHPPFLPSPNLSTASPSFPPPKQITSYYIQ